ncbi:hypothetical protein [Rhabdochromatium marinum]|uniref:hypothetical protein n=1 Tax=Rhabdochromatium marinum TaxID=48729 RepID=UPI0019032872|nr:hypothetical protein [Rhabdochromatium marinum]MBK1648173.1 hypothetical protein [Rhabdochromatium marinum]
MKERWLINGVLLLICALLLWLTRWQPAPPPGLAARVGLTPTEVTHIRLRHGDRPALVLETSPTGWMLRAPQRGPVTPAMSERIDALLRAPANPAFTLSDLSDPTDLSGREARATKLAELGLDNPWFVLELNDRRLDAGSAEPIDRRRYLRAGHDILLIDDRWLLPLLAAPAAYLSAPEPTGTTATPTLTDESRPHARTP